MYRLLVSMQWIIISRLLKYHFTLSQAIFILFFIRQPKTHDYPREHCPSLLSWIRNRNIYTYIYLYKCITNAILKIFRFYYLDWGPTRQLLTRSIYLEYAWPQALWRRWTRKISRRIYMSINVLYLLQWWAIGHARIGIDQINVSREVLNSVRLKFFIGFYIFIINFQLWNIHICI